MNLAKYKEFVTLVSELKKHLSGNDKNTEHYAVVFEVKDMDKFLKSLDRVICKYLEQNSQGELGGASSSLVASSTRRYIQAPSFQGKGRKTAMSLL